MSSRRQIGTNDNRAEAGALSHARLVNCIRGIVLNAGASGGSGFVTVNNTLMSSVQKAFNINNGDLLWQFQTDAGADAPVATYEVDGEQYVAILCGGSGFQLSQRGDSLWAFKLGGSLPQAPAPPEPPLTQPQRR